MKKFSIPLLFFFEIIIIGNENPNWTLGFCKIFVFPDKIHRFFSSLKLIKEVGTRGRALRKSHHWGTLCSYFEYKHLKMFLLGEMLKGEDRLPGQPLLMSFQYESAFALPVLPVDLLPAAHVCNVYEYAKNPFPCMCK